MVSNPLERPTLAERLVELIPLHYSVAALIWSLIFGGPSYYLIQLLVGNAPPPTLQLYSNLLLNVLLPFYVLTIVRYMRLRIIASEPRIAPRLPGGENDYQYTFRRISQTLPVLTFALGVGTLLLVLYQAGNVFGGVSPWLIIANIIVVYVNTLAFSSYLWEFIIASIGLYRLGSKLSLESFLEDRMMGARPLATLALSFTAAYFGSVLFAFLLLSAVLPSSLASAALFYFFIVIGISLFFMPLMNVHAKMQAEKRRLSQAMRTRYPRINAGAARAPTESATLDDVRNELTKLTDLQQLEMLERKVASLPTWPFDIQLLGRLITIVISVIAAFFARILIDLLHA